MELLHLLKVPQGVVDDENEMVREQFYFFQMSHNFHILYYQFLHTKYFLSRLCKL